MKFTRINDVNAEVVCRRTGTGRIVPSQSVGVNRMDHHNDGNKRVTL